MTKLEFMEELESLLLDIPFEEREEALNYYNDYFEDAGEDREEEIIAELGSPEQVADIIKADLYLNAANCESKGYFTEMGYQDTIYNNEKCEITDTSIKEADGSRKEEGVGASGTDAPGNTDGNEPNKNDNQNKERNTQTKRPNIALIILLCILVLPAAIPLACSVLGIMLGAVAVILGIIFGFGAAGVALICAGIALFFEGLIQIGVPFVGLVFCGGGLVVLGFGMLLILVCAALCRTVLPALGRGFVNLCRLPFRNRRVVA